MAFEFKLPDIGEGVVEGEITRWLVEEGSRVEEDQPMVEVMTDKATVEIPAPRNGIISKLNFPEGEKCPVGDVLLVIEVDGEDEAEEAPAEVVEAPVKAEAPASTPPPAPAAVVSNTPSKKVRAAPATRKLAREQGVDITRLQGTGPGGRVTRDDVLAAAGAPAAGPATSSPAPSQTASVVKIPVFADGDGPEEVREPLRGVRKAISSAMRKSIDRAAHFTYVEEIDCAQLKATRTSLKSEAQDRGARLSYLPFVIKACIQGLKAHPILNSMLDDSTQEIVFKNRYHIGIAAATDSGLMVPVIRDADRKSILELAAEIVDLSERAQSNRLSSNELRGSTFTITSLGALGGVLATPIINDPEVAILGIHEMKDRAVVRDGEIVIRPMMNVACSFDHRLIDGHVGAAFVQTVRGYLENPARLLMDLR